MRDERIRVVSLLDHLVPAGGAEVLVAAIARRLKPERFESIVCATRTVDDEVRAGLERDGVRVLHLDRTSRYRLDAWRPLVRLLRGHERTVVHAHKFGSNLWAALLRHVVDVPAVVAHEHVWSFEGDPLRRLLDRFVTSPVVDVTLTVSEATRRQMIEVEKLPPDRVRVFRHGIPRPAPSRDDRDPRRELGIATGDFAVGTVCVLRPQKAVERLLEAAALARRDVPNLRVVVVGDGPERAGLELLATRLGLDRVVVFAGARREVGPYVASFDVCVNSSRYEGSPLAVMEFMAAGKPIVATAVGGVPELLDDCGILVSPEDPEAIAAALVRLARDPGERERLGHAARRRQRTSFDLDANVRELEDLYEALVDGRRR